ncbi:MAG TPA: sigma factor-like helix-turn-helix DNA-binding protein [Pyrinomonadaceae bacterium]|nr:sigma factor-like helix-turn-helix DNA-binding protein [Pyrinomonadaceae bacterium]
MGEKANSRGRGGDRGISRLEAEYRLYARRVYTLCLRLLADRRAAEGATASAFVRLGGEVSGRPDDAKILDRLLELAVGESISRLGAAYGKAGAATAASASPSSVDVARPSGPLDAATLDRLTVRLPSRMRVAFVLRDVEGFGAARVAALMGVGEEDVRRLVRAARAELRRLWLGQN